jgi:hypothetical protein
MDKEPIVASVAWGGPERDVLTLLASPLPPFYAAEPSDADPGFVLYRETETEDADGALGEVVGLEILDFLGFDQWTLVPSLMQDWQLLGWPPLPLNELLRRLQTKLRAEVRMPIRA